MRICALLIALCSARVALAGGSYVVNQSDDRISATTCTGADAFCNAGQTANDNSDCTLREAIFEASCAGGPWSITFAPAVTNVQLDASNKTGNGFIEVGDVSQTATINIVGNTANPVTITAATSGAAPYIFDVTTGANVMTLGLSGLHLTGGDGTSDFHWGGAVTFRSETSNDSDALNIDHCLFDHNQAQNGGALNVSQGVVSISDSVFNDNSVSFMYSASGGAIAGNGYGTITILRTAFTNNQATTAGGAIYLDTSGSGSVVVRDSLFANNTVATPVSAPSVTDGGAIFTNYSLDLHNVTFFQNTVTQWTGTGTPETNVGGALAIVSPGFVTANNITISGNSAPSGGGVFVGEGADFTISNSIVSGDSGLECSVEGGGDIVSEGYNLLSSTCPANVTQTTDIISDAPGLANALAATTPTQTLALLPNSPAIDKGNPGQPTGTAPLCEIADQRGQTRPAGSACDIGAYEYVARADVGIVKQSSPNPVAGQPIVYTLLVSNAGPNDATSVVISDSLPAGLSGCSIQPQPACAISGNAVTCTFATLAANASQAIVLSCTAAAAGNLVNTAQVSHPEPDPNPTNDTSTDTTTVAAAPSAANCTPAGGAPVVCGEVLASDVNCETVKACAAAITAGRFQGGEIVGKGCSQVDPPSLLLLGLMLWLCGRRRQRIIEPPSP